MTETRPTIKQRSAMLRQFFETELADGHFQLYVETVLAPSGTVEHYPEAVTLLAEEAAAQRDSLAVLMKGHTVSDEQRNIAKDVLEDNDFPTPDDKDEWFIAFCLGILRAQHEAERLKAAHFSGDFANGEIKDPEFATCRNYFSQPDINYFHERNEQGLERYTASFVAEDTVSTIKGGKRGRKVGDGTIDDDEAVAEMRRLRKEGKAKSQNEAATMVARQRPHTGTSEESLTRRLNKKYRAKYKGWR